MHVNSAGGTDAHARLWRLQRDIRADPYSLSVPHDQFGCLVSLASFLHRLPLGKCEPALDRLSSIRGACQHRLGFVGLKSNDHLCSYSYPVIFALCDKPHNQASSPSRGPQADQPVITPAYCSLSKISIGRKSRTDTGFESANTADWTPLDTAQLVRVTEWKCERGCGLYWMGQTLRGSRLPAGMTRGGTLA
ncbi:uncharacterized [Tachysurus ichikawai]